MGAVIREQFYKSVSSPWVEELKASYQNAKPFPHIVLRGICDPVFLSQAAREYPSPSDGKWWEYKNVLEKKLARDDLHEFPESIQRIIWELQSNRFVSFLEKLTGISSLITDHTLNGGGLHQIIRGGKLDIHADYNYHPKTGLDRRLNVILYLNENWKEEWKGDLELWNKDMTECVQKISPLFNHLVIFNVNDWGYHGHPDPLLCPENVSRKSIALYYYSNGRPPEETTAPHSVIFKKRPQDEANEETDKLRDQRMRGRL